MDTRLLKHFLAVYDHRHFGRAAAAVGLSKQGLSKSIAKLEEQIDASLFSRGRSGVIPTEFGEALASHARLIMAETRLAEDEIAGLKNAEGGTVRVGCTPTLAEDIISQAVARMKQRSHRLDIRVTMRFPDTLLSMLSSGELDIIAAAFRSDLALPENVQKEVLYTTRDMVLCRPDHPILNISETDKSPIKLADLEGFPWIVPLDTDWVSNKIIHAFQNAGYTNVPELTESDSFNFIRNLVVQSDYLWYGSPRVFGWELDQGLMQQVFVPQLTTEREATIMTRKNSILPRAALSLIKEIRTISAERQASASNTASLRSASA